MALRFIACTALTVVLLATQTYAFERANASRQKEVERRGAQVMPFSLARTVHIFEKTKSGGIQQVIVKNASDTGQIGLIRMHLSEIAKEFAHGNFSDPARIHGKDMPGLAELENARPGELKIVYSELAKGAQIDYSSSNPAVIAAIHRWFNAQLADHAGALPGKDAR